MNSLLFCVLCFSAAFVSAKISYKNQTFTLPAYHTPGNGGISSRGEQMPLPDFKHRIGIQYWGNWKVIDANTNKELTLGNVFFHHITVFRAHDDGEREFLTGCSDDRRTLGPDLSDGYLQLVDSRRDDPAIQGYYHIVNLMSHGAKLAVQYEVVYVADDDIPDDTTFVKAHFLSTAYNVPGNGGRNSEHAEVTEVSSPTTGRVVSAVGHLHQGSKNVTLFDKKSKKALVSSEAIYADKGSGDECFYSEWCAQSGTPWTKLRVKDLSLKTGLNFMITKGQGLQMISYYDNGAEYRTVMAWIVLFVDENATS